MISYSDNKLSSDRSGNNNILPVPDIEPASSGGGVQYAMPSPDKSARKWLYISLAILGIAVVAGAIAFAIYVYVSGTPGYVLNAAMNNAVKGSGLAGDVTFDIKRGDAVTTQKGSFLSYSDPTNLRQGLLNINLGQGDTSVSATVELFQDGNYYQATGLENLGRLATSLGGDASQLTPQVLSGLAKHNGLWYSLTGDDTEELKDANDSISAIGPISGPPTASEFRRIQDIYLKHQFVVVAQQYPDERINNINCAHLSLNIDQAKLAAFISAIKDSGIKSLAFDDPGEIVQTYYPWLNNVKIEAWIARSDNTFQQFKVILPESNNGTDTITISMKSELVATRRQAVTVPFNPQSSEELIQSFSGLLP